MAGFGVGILFVLQQWKFSRYPLMPSSFPSLTFNQITLLIFLAKISSYFQAKGSYRCYFDHVCQWMELYRSGLLHPDLLSISVRILPRKSRKPAIAVDVDSKYVFTTPSVENYLKTH